MTQLEAAVEAVGLWAGRARSAVWRQMQSLQRVARALHTLEAHYNMSAAEIELISHGG